MHLTYTQTSLLTSTFAGASILAGLLAGGPARLWSRRARFWGGAIGMWVGADVLMVSPSFVLALIGPFLMGAFGTVVRSASPFYIEAKRGEKNAHDMCSSFPEVHGMGIVKK